MIDSPGFAAPTSMPWRIVFTAISFEHAEYPPTAPTSARKSISCFLSPAIVCVEKYASSSPWPKSRPQLPSI